MPASRGRIITFYSYKGGTGRSMALANVAWILAGAGRRVLVIDWDLEAPGLHRYFRPFLIDAELVATEGLMDLIDNYANEVIRPEQESEPLADDWYLQYAEFSNYIVSINFPSFPSGGKIDLLPAGRQCEQYGLAVSSFNWQNFYERLGGGGFLEAVKQQARSKYDYVLIDSRTGVSDTAGICSVQMPDTLVVCFTYNNQSIKGAAAVARFAAAEHEKLLHEKLALQRAGKLVRAQSIADHAEARYRIFPVPMRVDGAESERLALRQAFARASFAEMLGHLPAATLGEYWKAVEIPYTPFYAYEELLAAFKDDPHDPKSLLAAMLRLTHHVTDRDVTDYRLALAPQENQKILEAFADTGAALPSRKLKIESQQETPEQALARSAEAALAALPEADREVARRVFGRLVRIGGEEESRSLFAISALLDDFNETERRVVTALANQRLVLVTKDTPRSVIADQAMVMLADQRLLQSWPRLIEWLEQDRDFLVWRQQLRTYYMDWERNGRDRGALLSGRLLSEADLRLVRRMHDLTATEAEYIVASRDANESNRRVSEEYRPGLTHFTYRDSVKSHAQAWKVIAGLIVVAVVATGYLLGREETADLPPPRAVIRLPDFGGLPSEEAKSRAAALGLIVELTGDATLPADTPVSGEVIAQEPTANTLLPQGSRISLKVATLAATEVVPTVLGLDLDGALKALDKQKLQLGSTESKYVSDAEVGKVIGQDPAPAARVPVGTAVNVVVVRGPQLSDFRLGLYFPQDDRRADQLASDVRTLILKAGANVQRAPRPESYFMELRPKAVTDQIRYNSAAELVAARQLQQLLADASFGRFELIEVAQQSKDFISLFLVPDGTSNKAQ